ncbi:hypothetical protein SESBI_47028 [Sesbania bispinosa]|nr:hypothetical protein SESBI_47028 [Sesbania bispinosa]
MAALSCCYPGHSLEHAKLKGRQSFPVHDSTNISVPEGKDNQYDSTGTFDPWMLVKKTQRNRKSKQENISSSKGPVGSRYVPLNNTLTIAGFKENNLQNGVPSTVPLDNAKTLDVQKVQPNNRSDEKKTVQSSKLVGSDPKARKNSNKVLGPKAGALKKSSGTGLKPSCSKAGKNVRPLKNTQESSLMPQDSESHKIVEETPGSKSQDVDHEMVFAMMKQIEQQGGNDILSLLDINPLQQFSITLDDETINFVKKKSAQMEGGIPPKLPDSSLSPSLKKKEEGAKSKEFMSLIKDLKRLYYVSFFILLETKVHSDHAKRIAKHVNLDGLAFVEVEGFSGAFGAYGTQEFGMSLRSVILPNPCI